METLPTIAPIEPTIIKNNLDFEWNHKEVEAYLLAITEKYRGLTATEETLPAFEKSKREVVRLRTALTKFKAEGKRKLTSPANRFAKKCDSLLAIVEEVEMPINAQLAQFEERRVTKLKEEIETEYQAKASVMCLDMSYWELDYPKKWFNKTQKWSDTCCDIDNLIKEQLARQKADEDRAEIIKQKREILVMTVEQVNKEYELKTPISADMFNEKYSDELLDVLSLEELKGRIKSKAEEQKAIEEAAAKANKEIEEPVKEPLEEIQPKEEPITNPFADMVPTGERMFFYGLHFETGEDERVEALIDRFVNDMKSAGVVVQVEKGEF